MFCTFRDVDVAKKAIDIGWERLFDASILEFLIMCNL